MTKVTVRVTKPVADHPIETMGKELRSMMGWLKEKKR